MNKRKSLVFISLLLISSLEHNSATKVWIEDPNFDSPDTFESGYLPCSQDEIEFPESYSASILLPPTIDTAGLILPKDGALFLSLNAVISFDRSLDNGRKCKNSNQVAKVKGIPARRWFDPDNWHDTLSSPNPAVPHIHRIPCNQEMVKISATGPLSIDLNDIHILRVGQIELAGGNVSSEFMEQLFRSELGDITFKDVSSTKVEYDKDSMCGCVHSDLVWDYGWNLCHPMQSKCEKPKCLTPIVPFGHCCPLCGSIVELLIDECNISYRDKMKALIEKSLKEQEMEDQLIYHVSIVDTGLFTCVQAVILDKDDYEEKSIQFMRRFNETLDPNVFKGHKIQLHKSGSPYNANVLGPASLLMLLTLLGVLSFFAVVFISYSPDNGIVRLPRWMHVRWHDLFHSPFVFARFENTAAAEGEVANNIVIDVQQYNAPPENEQRATGTSTSFDNPMFVENTPGNRSPQDSDDIPLCEEDLTEIDLGTDVEGRV